VVTLFSLLTPSGHSGPGANADLMAEVPSDRPTRWVFVASAGGGAKGRIHVGALKALEDRQFCGLAGTSAAEDRADVVDDFGAIGISGSRAKQAPQG
jgi:hypothetical protein